MKTIVNVLKYISLNIPEHIYKYCLDKKLKIKTTFHLQTYIIVGRKTTEIMTLIDYVFIRPLLS